MAKAISRSGVILVCTLLATAATSYVTWIRIPPALTRIQGQNMTLTWTVNVSTPIIIIEVLKDNKEVIFQNVEENTLRVRGDYVNRPADLNLTTYRNGSIWDITFTMYNLVKTTDEGEYKVDLVTQEDTAHLQQTTPLTINDIVSWTQFPSLVSKLHGQNLSLNWTVNIAARKMISVVVSRTKYNGRTRVITYSVIHNKTTVQGSHVSRASDLYLEVNTQRSMVNIRFRLLNLQSTDQAQYDASVVFESNTTSVVPSKTQVMADGTATTITISQSADSVDVVQGQTSRLFWSVTISGSHWLGITISRNQQKSDSGSVDIIKVIRQTSQQETIYLQGIVVDLDVQGNSTVFNVTFTIGNLTTTDQMYYRIQVVSESADILTKYLFMQVLDAAFTWIHYDDSVDFIQGQTAQLNWTVDIGSKYRLFGVYIRRGQENLVRKTSSGITKHLPGREADIDLVVQGTSNVVNVTFILRNLIKTDEMVYRITLIKMDSEFEAKSTFLRVLAVPGRPVLRVQPNQMSYCRNRNVRIMLNCNVSIGNPTSTNLRFFQNNAEFNRINGSHSGSYSQAVFTRRLNQSGTYLFTCQATNIIGSGPRSNVVTITNKDPPAISNCSNATVMEGNNLVWTCDANGSEPLTTFWYRENNNTVIQSGRRLTIVTVSRADAGMYRFTASNGEACPAASKTVYLDVHRKKNSPNCTDSTFEVTTGQCVSIQTGGNPLPALNCFPKGNIMTSRNGNSYTMCGVKNTTTSICTISNAFGSCSIIIKVHQRVPEYTYKGFFKITNQNFNGNLKYKNNVEYKTLESRIANMLKTVYKSYKYTSTNVIGFWPGSVIVVFQLKLVANINDPLLPIVEASKRNGGLIAGFQIDSNSIQPGVYTPPPTMTFKTSTTSSPQATFTSSQYLQYHVQNAPKSRQ